MKNRRACNNHIGTRFRDFTLATFGNRRSDRSCSTSGSTAAGLTLLNNEQIWTAHSALPIVRTTIATGGVGTNFLTTPLPHQEHLNRPFPIVAVIMKIVEPALCKTMRSCSIHRASVLALLTHLIHAASAISVIAAAILNFIQVTYEMSFNLTVCFHCN